MQTVIQILSETHAEQAKRLLTRSHIAFESRKKTTPSGCVIILRISAPAETVHSLLRRNRIPYQNG